MLIISFCAREEIKISAAAGVGVKRVFYYISGKEEDEN